MQSYRIPFGTQQVEFSLPDGIHPTWIAPEPVIGVPDPTSAVHYALDNPVGISHLSDYSNAHQAALAINDKTRPVPHEHLLPPLLQKLEELGLAPKSIRLIVATGTHSPMGKNEFSKVVPQEILDRYPVESHDCDENSNLTNLGNTSHGTPIWVNRKFLDADLRIVVGDIEPHHFMGYSGGVKTAAIGLAGRETINLNHSMLTHPNAITAHYSDNPMRMDVEEIGKRIGIHFALNAILNQKKEIVNVLWGDPLSVMNAGIPLVQQICEVPVEGKFDLVIASAGGNPKDINFYQSEKALTHAAMITRDGGTIVLAAACEEGVGSPSYERWIDTMHSHSAVIQRFSREGFQIGPHKAFQVARIATRVNLLVMSQMLESTVQKLLLNPIPSVQAGIEQVFSNTSRSLRIAIMPYAVATIPRFAEG